MTFRKSESAMQSAASLLASVCLLTSALAAQSSYRIAGTVVSKIDGHPLSRARVTLSDTTNEQKAASVVTSDDGHFEFTDVPPGKFSLRGAKLGFIASYYEQHENFWTGIVTAAGLDTENFALKLTPSAVISGQILDESGDPVRHARITLYLVDHSEGVEKIRTSGQTQTDDLGSYEFPNLNAGTYFVSATAQPWYAVHASSQPANSRQSGDNFDRTLDVSYPLTYYADATDADSATPIPIRGGEHLQVDLHLNPVPALHLFVKVPGSRREGFTTPIFEQLTFDGAIPAQIGSTRMSSPGTLEVSGIPAGRYNIRLHTNGTTQEIDGIDLAQDGEKLDATNAGTLADVKITARMSDGSALPKQIGLTLRSHRRGNQPNTQLDEKGQGELPQISAGIYEPMVWGTGKRFFIAKLSADGAQVTGHTLTIPASASVSLSLTISAGSAELEGIVKRAGKPFGGAMVVLIPRNAEGNRDLFRRDQSDLDGTFALRDVIPGAYTVTAIEDGWDLDWSQPEVIAAYAKHGQPIQIPSGSNLKIHIPAPVEVQPR